MRRAEICLTPFPHALCYPALPEGLYADLEASYPSWQDVVAGRPLRQNARYDWSGKTCLANAPAVWREFVREYTGRSWWRAMVEWFGPVISLAYPQLRWGSAGGLEGASTALRFTDPADFYLDCQIGVNTPCTERSRVSVPHVDNPVQLIGGLLYFGEDSFGGDLVIHSVRKKPVFVGKRDVSDALVDTVKVIPYRHNTAVFFLGTQWSIHSVTERLPGAPARRLVTIPVEVNRPLFDIPR